MAQTERSKYSVGLLLLCSVVVELLSNLVFEDCWSCGDLVRVGGFNSVFESNAGDDLGEIIKAA